MEENYINQEKICRDAKVPISVININNQNCN